MHTVPQFPKLTIYHLQINSDPEIFVLTLLFYPLIDLYVHLSLLTVYLTTR